MCNYVQTQIINIKAQITIQLQILFRASLERGPHLGKMFCCYLMVFQILAVPEMANLGLSFCAQTLTHSLLFKMYF